MTTSHSQKLDEKKTKTKELLAKIALRKHATTDAMHMIASTTTTTHTHSHTPPLLLPFPVSQHHLKKLQGMGLVDCVCGISGSDDTEKQTPKDKAK